MTTPIPESPRPPFDNYARWGVAAVIFMVAVATGVYHLIREGQLEQTAVLFIGLPAFIAIGIVLLRARKAPPCWSSGALRYVCCWRAFFGVRGSSAY